MTDMHESLGNKTSTDIRVDSQRTPVKVIVGEPTWENPRSQGQKSVPMSDLHISIDLVIFSCCMQIMRQHAANIFFFLCLTVLSEIPICLNYIILVPLSAKH